MARQTDDLREWVVHKWPDLLTESIRRSDARRRLAAGDAPYESMYLEEQVVVPCVADIVDPVSPRTAERNIRRWLDRTRVPEPDLIRVTLAALEQNWTAGLARAGYQAHAIYLLHGLYAIGARTLAVRSAKLAFFESTWTDTAEDESQWHVPEVDADRLDRAAVHCWPALRGEIPRSPSAPRRSDFLASKGLLSACYLLDAALHTSTWDFMSAKRRIYAVQDEVARFVLNWANEVESLT